MFLSTDLHSHPFMHPHAQYPPPAHFVSHAPAHGQALPPPPGPLASMPPYLYPHQPVVLHVCRRKRGREKGGEAGRRMGLCGVEEWHREFNTPSCFESLIPPPLPPSLPQDGYPYPYNPYWTMTGVSYPMRASPLPSTSFLPPFPALPSPGKSERGPETEGWREGGGEGAADPSAW